MWLLILYGFLGLTAAAAAVSVACLVFGIRRFRTALLAFLPAWVLANLALAYGVHRTAYAIESHDSFCVSCHLHQGEYERFRDGASPVARDLAGYHRRRAQNFTCITCHVGEGVDGRGHVLFYAGMDVAHYTTGEFERDLVGMKHPLGDTTCVKCHPSSKGGEFHKSPNHAGDVAECLTCHSAHARGDEAFGFVDYTRWPSQKSEPCLGCHPALLG